MQRNSCFRINVGFLPDIDEVVKRVELPIVDTDENILEISRNNEN